MDPSLLLIKLLLTDVPRERPSEDAVFPRAIPEARMSFCLFEFTSGSCFREKLPIPPTLRPKTTLGNRTFYSWRLLMAWRGTSCNAIVCVRVGQPGLVLHWVLALDLTIEKTPWHYQYSPSQTCRSTFCCRTRNIVCPHAHEYP